MAVPSEEFQLAYQDSCAGTTLLLIHGFPLNSNLWESQMEDLRDVARVLAPDLRGHGLSAPGKQPYSISMMAEDCLGLLEAVGVQQPAVVCGHSMGGYVALEFFRQFPEWVSALILVSTRATADTEEGKAKRDEMAQRAHDEGVTIVAHDMLPALFAPQNYEEDEELVGFVRDMMESTSLKGMVGALQAMKERPDSTPLLAEIDVPVLIVQGEEDQIVGMEEAEAMYEAIEDAQLTVIPGAGHLPNLEQPMSFNEAVWDFLQMLREEEG